VSKRKQPFSSFFFFTCRVVIAIMSQKPYYPPPPQPPPQQQQQYYPPPQNAPYFSVPGSEYGQQYRPPTYEHNYGHVQVHSAVAEKWNLRPKFQGMLTTFVYTGNLHLFKIFFGLHVIIT